MNIAELVIAAQNGDRKAMGTLIESTQKDVYRFCYYLCGNKTLAQDLMQDAFVRVLENIKKIDDPSKFNSWVFRTAKNLFLDHVKSPKFKEQSSAEMPEAASKESIESLVQIRQAMDKMTADERFLILLADLQRASYAEIAEILGITEEAVTSRLFKARENFKKILKA